MSCFCLRLQKDVVKTLDFRHCSLNFVPEEIYDYDETLEELFLDSNNVKDLPRSLFHCEFLRILSVCDNDLRAVPSAVATLVNLEQLDISKNAIVELPDSIKCCKNLSMVEISVNPLGKLPEGFTQLVNLTQLYLNDTLLNYLPANFGRLIKLTVLELRENRLKALPRSMARLTELERLDLGMNEFRQLPEVIGFFTKLTELWVDSNKLTSVPSAIGNLKQLVYFDASCNRIESLPSEIQGLDSLTDLHLSKNYLQELPKSIGQLSNLQNLKLDCNQISFLPYSIGGLVSLEELILTFNDLEELPPSIGLLRKLNHLNVDQNMLLDLPSELGSCSSISLLSLQSNLLMTLPDEIGHISSLSVVNLSNNQLRYLPYKITKLKNLQALWLSENQSKPLIPLQSEMQKDIGKRVLTCFLFPQQHREPEDDNYQSDGESFHASVWEEQRLSRRQIAFDVSESDSERNLKRAPTPYPKEGVKRKNLSTKATPSSKLRGAHGQRGIILPNYPSVDTSSRHGQQGGPREGKARRPRSPGSPISDSLHLFQADKEKMAKDKARLRGSISSVSRQDSDTESVASSTRERVMGRREIRARMDRAAMSDSEAFIQSPVWSHTEKADASKRPVVHKSNSKSPRSGAMRNGRGYESDQVDAFRTPIRSPKVPQMQVGRDQVPRSGGGIGYSRGYESDGARISQRPLDDYVHRREKKDSERNRNCNAASTSVDGRQSWRLSNQRSSGYSTDPERSYMKLANGSRESRMADVKQKREEMLPPPYYRVRQLRAGADSKAQRNTPRRHASKGQPQNLKDYGWIDGDLPEGQSTVSEPQGNHNPEVNSRSYDTDKRNQLMGSDSHTPHLSSRQKPHMNPRPVRSRGDPSAYSDTEVAFSQRRVRQQSVEPSHRVVHGGDLKQNRTSNPTKGRVSPVFDKADDRKSGFQTANEQTVQDRDGNNSTTFDNRQQIDGAVNQGADKQTSDTRPQSVNHENHNMHVADVQEPIQDHRRHPDFTPINDSRDFTRHQQNPADSRSSAPLEDSSSRQDQATEDGNQDYLSSLEERRRQTAELQRNTNPRGSHSLPRDIREYPQQLNGSFRPDVADSQKSSSLPRSETQGAPSGKDEMQRNRVNGMNDRYSNIRRTDRRRLHGGAPDYTASEPELRRPIQPHPGRREDVNKRDTYGTPVDSRTGDRRRSQSPISHSDHRRGSRELGGFPSGLSSSTPSVDGGSRPQSPVEPRPRSPSDNVIPRYRNRPGSPKDQDPPQINQYSNNDSYHPVNRHRDSKDNNFSRPYKPPLRPNDGHYDGEYYQEKANYSRRGSDSSNLHQVHNQQHPKTNHSRPYQPPYRAGPRDSLPESLPTPIVADPQDQVKVGNIIPGLDHQRFLQSQGPLGQSSRIPCPDLWPQDSSGYASDPNDQGWKRGSCSTPTSSVQGPSSPPMWRPGSDVTPPNLRSRHPVIGRHDNPPPATRRLPLVIYKNPGLGFSITGGRDAPGNPFKPFDWGIFVTKIQPGGPADGILLPGDKLLEVNGRSYDSILHDDAVNMLRKSNPVSLVVQRNDQ